MQTLQVTLGAGATPLVAALAAAGQSPTQIRIAFQHLIIQNNAAHSCRVGSSDTVSATVGIYLSSGPGGGSLTIALPLEYSGDLSEYCIFGTAADVIDIMFSS